MRLKIISLIAVWGVVFNNFHLGSGILLTDIVYTALSLFLFFEIGSKPFKLEFFVKLLASFVAFFYSLALLNLLRYQNLISFFSRMRFVWGLWVTLMLYGFFKTRNCFFLKRFYLGLVFFSSSLIIIQNICFHFYNTHFFFSFGGFDLMENSTFYADPSNPLHRYIRSGGLFRESSWFAIFSMPALFMTFSRDYLGGFLLLISGLILSTSTLGYSFILIFFIERIFFSGFKKKVLSLIVLIFIFFACILTYSQNVYVFERLIFFLETGGSFDIRFLQPFELVWENFSMLGVDTNFIKSENERMFVGSFFYVFYSFGLIGTCFFCILTSSLRTQHFFYSFCLLIIVLVEGLTGRIDFWILILFFLLLRSSNHWRNKFND